MNWKWVDFNLDRQDSVRIGSKPSTYFSWSWKVDIDYPKTKNSKRFTYINVHLYNNYTKVLTCTNNQGVVIFDLMS